MSAKRKIFLNSWVLGFGVLGLTLLALTTWFFTTGSGLRFALNQVPGVAYASANGKLLGPMEFEKISYKLSGSEISAESLSLDWELTDLLFDRTITVSRITGSAIEIVIADESESQAERATSELEPIISPMKLVLADLSFGQLAVKTTTARHEIDALRLSDVVFEQSLLSLAQLHVKKGRDVANLNGHVDLSFARNAKVALALSHRIQEFADLDLALVGEHRLDGTWQQLLLHSSFDELMKADIDATIEGILSERMSWQVNAALNTLNLTDLSKIEGVSHPNEIRLRGRVNGDGNYQNANLNAKFLIDNAQARTHSQESQQTKDEPYIELSAQISGLDKGPNFDITLLGQRLDTLAPLFDTQLSRTDAEVRLIGTLDNYALSSNMRAKDTPIGDMNLSFTAAGNSKQLQTDALTLNSDNVNLSSDLLITRSEDNRIGVGIKRAKGDVLGKPFSATASISGLMSESEINVQELAVELGGSSVNVHGQLGNKIDLEWDLQIANMEDLLADSQGDFFSKGTLLGSREEPQLNLKLSSNGLRVAELTLGPIKGNVVIAHHQQQHDLQQLADTVDSSNINSTLKIQNIELGDKPITESMDVLLTGSLSNHQLKLVSKFEPQSSAEMTWSGSLVNDKLSFNVETSPVPFSAVEPLLADNDFDLFGTLSLTANGELAIDQSLLVMDMRAHSEELRLEPQNDSNQAVSLTNLEITLNADKAQSSMSASALMNKDGELDLKASIAEPLLSKQFHHSEFSLNALLSYPDIAALNPLLPSGAQLSGALRSTLTATGSLEEPQIAVNTVLNDGVLAVPEIGLELRDVTVDLAPSSEVESRFVVSAAAGEGVLSADGKISNTAPFSITTNVKARGAQVLNSDEITARIGADLDLNWSQDKASINGTLAVESANISVGVAPGVVKESNDVVILGQTDQRDTGRVDMDIQFDLGRNTFINASGLTGRLAGKPRIKTDENQLLTSVGDISVVDGSFNLLGQPLTVRKGVARYTGGSIENPSLDIEAVRKVDQVTAGVRVFGASDSPNISLFSQPYYSDQDILALLFFDKPVANLGATDAIRLVQIANAIRTGNNATSRVDGISNAVGDYLGVDELDVNLSSINGDSAVSVSSKINSRIDVGYAYNLVSALQSLFVRYKISNHWFIQSSVDTDTGADLIFKDERD